MRHEEHGQICDTVLATLYNIAPTSSNNPSILVFSGLMIKVDEGLVFRDNTPIQLNYSEFAMLCHLARHPGIIFTHNQLYTAVHGEDFYNSNTVPNTICRIRSKIEPNPKRPLYIKTVIGMGYKFDAPELL